MKQDDNTAKRRKEWIRLLRIGKEVGHYMKVCSKHFKETDYILPGKKNFCLYAKFLSRVYMCVCVRFESKHAYLCPEV
ncbi:hypothetical protein X975_25102, partial [Stegodyphus mimosarum]